VTDTPASPSDPRGSRRSVVLQLMAGLGNAYLVLFAVDAVLSIPDLLAGDPELHAMASAHPAMYSARLTLGLVILLASVLLPFVLLFVPQLPRLPFVAPVAFSLVAGFGRFLTSLTVESLAIIQPFLAAASFLLVELSTGAWWLRSARLPHRRHLVLRTAVATLVTIVALPLAAAALLVLLLLSTLEHQSAGYLDVTVAGIDARETVLTKDGHTVVLKPMLHFGEDDFYRTLFDGIPPGSLVLAEGITDREKRLLTFPSASKIARVLGLANQPDPRAMLPAAVASDRPRAVERTSHSPDATSPPDIVNADVDTAEFSEATLGVQRDVARIYDSDSIADALRRLLARNRPREELALLKRELVDMRNAKVLARLDDEAPTHATIVLPWGAMHMPGLEAGLTERGYRIDAQRRRPVLRFDRLVGWLTGKRPA
jgi:hypothetical protein